MKRNHSIIVVTIQIKARSESERFRFFFKYFLEFEIFIIQGLIQFNRIEKKKIFFKYIFYRLLSKIFNRNSKIKTIK